METPEDEFLFWRVLFGVALLVLFVVFAIQQRDDDRSFAARCQQHGGTVLTLRNPQYADGFILLEEHDRYCVRPGFVLETDR